MAENFISAMHAYGESFESPTCFWKWGAISTIATIMRDRCYIRNGNSFTFPNLYILFLAESSGWRKGRPVEISQQLAAEIHGIKSISGRTSVQAIIDELAITETDQHTGKVIKCSAATIFAPEMKAGIVNDTEGMGILTDIYDYKPFPYKQRLRSREPVNLEKVVLSMFAASNEAMLKGLFDTSVIEGGFLARTLLIIPHDSEYRKGKSLLEENDEVENANFRHMIEHLKRVNQITGRFHFNSDAVKEYDGWYLPFHDAYKEKKEKTGIVGRIHTHVLKVGMTLAANDLTVCVQKKHMEEAIDLCLNLLKHYNTFTMSNAKTDLGNIGGAIVLDLCTAKDNLLSRKAIVRAHWQNMDMDLLDKAVDALKEAGMIEVITSRTEIYYRLTKTALDQMK